MTHSILIRVSLFGLALLSIFVPATYSLAKQPQTDSPTTADPEEQMVFLQFYDPRFREGLRKEHLLDNAGYRILNTGFDRRPFGERWLKSKDLETARNSGQPYYIDRISGGMPFQSLEGIEGIAKSLSTDPSFLGFQVHEWGNSPMHDYHRIQRHLIKKNLPFDEEHFAPFEGRVEHTFFSGGNYSIYRDLYQPLHTLDEVEHYLESYFKQVVERTSGQVMSVTGHTQLHHAALRLGAKNVMAEIGNQVSLSAFQISFARGAARQHGKPFGVYYEPWANSGVTCHTRFSPWFSDITDITKKSNTVASLGGANVGPQYGSKRALQRRLLFFSWLAGASYWSEEWGAENYFSDWETHPLTEYGRIVKEFKAATDQHSKPKPIVPVVLVMPPDHFGVDIRYVSGRSNNLYMVAPPDNLHNRLREFAAKLLASKDKMGAPNLTSSPWISSFDVLDAEADSTLLENYDLAIYFDEKQAQQSSLDPSKVLFWKEGALNENTSRCIELLNKSLKYEVDGKVGSAHARSNGEYLLGVFNNWGVYRKNGLEKHKPEASQKVVIHGPCKDYQFIMGNEYVISSTDDHIELLIPAGAVTVLAFPEDK